MPTIEVLMPVYAKCLDDAGQTAKIRIQHPHAIGTLCRSVGIPRLSYLSPNLRTWR